MLNHVYPNFTKYKQVYICFAKFTKFKPNSTQYFSLSKFSEL